MKEDETLKNKLDDYLEDLDSQMAELTAIAKYLREKGQMVEAQLIYDKIQLLSKVHLDLRSL